MGTDFSSLRREDELLDYRLRNGGHVRVPMHEDGAVGFGGGGDDGIGQGQPRPNGFAQFDCCHGYLLADRDRAGQGLGVKAKDTFQFQRVCNQLAQARLQFNEGHD